MSLKILISLLFIFILGKKLEFLFLQTFLVNSEYFGKKTKPSESDIGMILFLLRPDIKSNQFVKENPRTKHLEKN